MRYKFIGKSLFFSKEKILAIADLHIGYEEAMNKAGIFFPRVQFKEIMKDLEKIFKETGNVKEIVVVGDLKHEFGKISDQEWSETLKVLDFLKEKSEKVILIRGNHDKILGPIAEKREIEIKDYYVREGICFVHGDKIFAECLDKRVKIIVMGHRHPAVMLSDKYKKEKYKCFLVGNWKKKEVIILPSFFPIIEGTDIINMEENNLLFIPENELRKFRVYVIGDRVYNFKNYFNF